LLEKRREIKEINELKKIESIDDMQLQESLGKEEKMERRPDFLCKTLDTS